MKIAVACDHAGYHLKETIINTIKLAGHDVIDLGTHSTASVDYPDFALKLGKSIQNNDAERGVLICGSGVGACIAANKIKGVYAAICHDTYSAHQGVEHDNMNVLCLGSRIIGQELAKEIVKAFLNAAFSSEERHLRRVSKFKQIENDLNLQQEQIMSNPIINTHSIGQSIWYDNIERRLIKNGQLSSLIEDGIIYGITSNPSIFQKAIASSSDYDSHIQPMSWSGLNPDEIFYELAIQDIRDTADLFHDLYIKSNRNDGYVSLEVNPLLAHDTEATIKEAKRLWKKVNRNNLMVKIPATKAGIPAIRSSIAAGINVNVTLIFSIERYKEVIDAFLSGLEDRLNAGLLIDNIASVASFFVSRVDTKVDSLLDQLLKNGKTKAEKVNNLKGRTALANSRLAYFLFLDIFQSQRFEQLKARNARIQRPLWASTSTKNPAYSDVLYVEELIAPNTVNTIPPNTLTAFLEHGKVGDRIHQTREVSLNIFKQLEEIGIVMHSVTDELEAEGVKAFSDSYISLLQTIDQRREHFIAELGPLQNQVEKAAKRHRQNQTIKRLFDHDASLWSDSKEVQVDIKDRLGWLDLPNSSLSEIEELTRITNDCVNAGFTNAVLLGMGGSSLAPEVIAKTFSHHQRDDASGIKLDILDSTDPVEINNAISNHNLKNTLFIVSSKSGTTTETIALMEFFRERLKHQGIINVGDHFIAVTDPDTPLVALAKKSGFREIVLANPDVGGRYSALSVFGLLPAALIGVNLKTFLHSAQEALDNCSPDNLNHTNLGLLLGLILGEAHNYGIDKLTIFSDLEFKSVGSWLEQLLAESSGKEGKGILPIDNEPLYTPNEYEKDRLFVYFKDSGEQKDTIAKLINAGFPVITIEITNFYDLAAQFFAWEIATAVACSVIGVNAFDQPNVQESKDQTSKKIDEFQSNGRFIIGKPLWQDDLFDIFLSNFENDQVTPILSNFLQSLFGQSNRIEYFAISAFLDKSSTYNNLFMSMREELTKKYHAATTFGFGPRYLHSTGQLHKGGSGNGINIIFTRNTTTHLSIPGQALQFKDLITAQALGDYEALSQKGHKVLRINITGGSTAAALQQFLKIL